MTEVVVLALASGNGTERNIKGSKVMLVRLHVGQSTRDLQKVDHYAAIAQQIASVNFTTLSLQILRLL